MCRLCMTGSRLTAAPGKTATTMPSESCLPPARSTGLTRSASPFAAGMLSVPTGARPPGSLTGISLTFGRPITDGAHTSVEWWAILRSDQGTATLSGALNLAVRPGRPLRGTPRILAPRRGPRHPPRQTAGDGSAPRDRHASCRAERTGCSLLVYAFGGDTAHRHPMTCRRFGTTLAVPWHVARPDM